MNRTVIKQDHTKLMGKAVKASHQSIKTNEGGPFGAVIVMNGKVIACEANSVTSTNDPTAHAEVNAIRAACRELGTPDLDGCVMYTSCEPCPMCTAAIYWAKIKKVYYANTSHDAEQAGFGDRFISEELSKPLSKRSIEFIRLGADEAKKVFEEWMDKSRSEKEDIKKGTL